MSPAAPQLVRALAAHRRVRVLPAHVAQCHQRVHLLWERRLAPRALHHHDLHHSRDALSPQSLLAGWGRGSSSRWRMGRCKTQFTAAVPGLCTWGGASRALAQLSSRVRWLKHELTRCRTMCPGGSDLKCASMAAIRASCRTMWNPASGPPICSGRSRAPVRRVQENRHPVEVKEAAAAARAGRRRTHPRAIVEQQQHGVRLVHVLSGAQVCGAVPVGKL